MQVVAINLFLNMHLIKTEQKIISLVFSEFIRRSNTNRRHFKIGSNFPLPFDVNLVLPMLMSTLIAPNIISKLILDKVHCQLRFFLMYKIFCERYDYGKFLLFCHVINLVLLTVKPHL